MARTKQTSRVRDDNKTDDAEEEMDVSESVIDNKVFTSKAKIWTKERSAWVDKGLGQLEIVNEQGVQLLRVYSGYNNSDKTFIQTGATLINIRLNSITSFSTPSDKRTRIQANNGDYLIQFPADENNSTFVNHVSNRNVANNTSLDLNADFSRSSTSTSSNIWATSSTFNLSTPTAAPTTPVDIWGNPIGAPLSSPLVSVPGFQNEPKSTKRKRATKEKKWWWLGDNTWNEYDAETSRKLERAHQNGEGRQKVDEERFVDLKNMLQRRYDNESKRRQVRRGNEDESASESNSDEDQEGEKREDMSQDGSGSEEQEDQRKVKERTEKEERDRREIEQKREKERLEANMRFQNMEEEMKRTQKTPFFTNSVLDLDDVIGSWGSTKKDESESDEKPVEPSKVKKSKKDEEEGEEEESEKETKKAKSSSQSESQTGSPSGTPSKRRIIKRKSSFLK